VIGHVLLAFAVLSISGCELMKNNGSGDDVLCTPNCSGRQCGDDGCGGSCGTCKTGTCQNSKCVGTGFYDPCPGEMCSIPSASFYMGCNDGSGECQTNALDDNCEDNDRPCHPVTLSGYSIDRTEVTIAAYGKCVDLGKCTAPTGKKWNDRVANANFPVDFVSWDDATAYCVWAGKRLCTEAEWENAARGTNGWLYPWGNQAPTCDRAVFPLNGQDCTCGNAMNSSCTVGYAPGDVSSYGVQDMAGNASEWVLDSYESDYYKNCKTGCTNPMGPQSNNNKVIRGGGSNGGALGGNLRASHRAFTGHTVSDWSLGFRCCKAL
jgi:formylglycine-generating enzyme required for sulfatase activity